MLPNPVFNGKQCSINYKIISSFFPHFAQSEKFPLKNSKGGVGKGDTCNIFNNKIKKIVKSLYKESLLF